MLIHPITLKGLTVPNNIFYAPLAGCSDFAYRAIAAQFSPGLIFCEMVKMDALVRCDQTTFRMLQYTHDMHPIGAQLCGSNPAFAAPSARIIEDMGFDVIDVNCGCPVDKVTKDGGGSSLLKTPHLIGDIISQLCAHTSLPVTIKIRAGWDDDSLVFEQIVLMAEQAGAQAVTIHGRTRKQAYTGKANRSWIARAKAASHTIQVFGNGDVFTPQDAFSMMQETHCDGVMIARGTFGQPWIADDIIQCAQDPSYTRPYCEQLQAFKDHMALIVQSTNDHKALLDMRRISSWYTTHIVELKPFKHAFQQASTLEEMAQVLALLPLESRPKV